MTTNELELTKEEMAYRILSILMKDKVFINVHKSSYNLESITDWEFAVLADDTICPIRLNSEYCSLNPLHIGKRGMVRLSPASVGGVVYHNDYQKYNDSYIEVQRGVYGRDENELTRLVGAVVRLTNSGITLTYKYNSSLSSFLVNFIRNLLSTVSIIYKL